MEFLLIRNAFCTVVPFEMHLIANRKKRERRPTMQEAEAFFSSSLSVRIQI